MPKIQHIIMSVDITTKIMHTTELYYFICHFFAVTVQEPYVLCSQRGHNF